MKKTEAIILKVILTSSYFDDPYHLWYLSGLLLVIYLKPKTPLNKENTTKKF